MGFDAGGESSVAIDAWNLMGGIDWAALPLVVEMYGVEDIEVFIAELIAIRDHVTRQANAK